MIMTLCSELLAIGGIQRASRHVAAVLATFAARKGMAYRSLSLNDAVGHHCGAVGEREFDFRGFSRAKGRFVSTALRHSFSRPKLVVAAHPHLAPLAWAIKKLAPTVRTLVITYGIDVWTPLWAPRRWALRRADLVLAISSDTARHLVTVQGVREERIRVLPLGLDPAFSFAATAGDGGTHGSHMFPDGKIVLTVGRQVAPDRYKGVDVLIQAVSKLVSIVPDVALVIIGDGDDCERLKRTARESGIEARVHFLGNVPGETLVAAYRRCDVFAMPSAGEGFGLVFLEAMAFGKPVIGGAHGGTVDVVEDGVTGYLVRHGDLDRLAQVLERLLADDGLRKEMGRRARERVQSTYLFERFERRLTDILEEACPL